MFDRSEELQALVRAGTKASITCEWTAPPVLRIAENGLKCLMTRRI